jgi:hypothetical protein
MRFGLLLLAVSAVAADRPAEEYRKRVETVTDMPGFVALWDFVKRDGGPEGRFDAVQPKGATADLRLDAVNYVRDYWGEGRPARYADFPLLGEGPFGQAVQFRNETQKDFRPLLMVPRERVHNTGLDVKGARRSVAMVAWIIRESGNHAIGGIWHEGTDLQHAEPAKRVEPGKRQYAIFAGLAGNPGASAAHVSENGARSFGDRYARNMAVTREVIPEGAWAMVGFSFDNERNTVTAFLDGEATDYWIDDPAKHPFYQYAFRGWQQAQLAKMAGVQAGEDPSFPKDQFYEPPEGKPLRRKIVERTPEQQVEVQEFEFTKVRVTLRRDAGGKFREVVSRELVALKANPFWFPHDLYAPQTVADGGPFTIGRVIHTSRSVGFTGYIGGVAVFGRPLTKKQMQRLAEITRAKPIRLKQTL